MLLEKQKKNIHDKCKIPMDMKRFSHSLYASRKKEKNLPGNIINSKILVCDWNRYLTSGSDR